MSMRARARTWFGEEEVTAEIYLLRGLIQRPVVTVMQTAPLAELHALLADERVPALAVIDAEANLRGVVTRTDVLNALLSKPDAKAADVMSNYVFAIPRDSTVESAAALIATENVGQVVVTGSEGELVGIVSAVDIARHVAQRAGYLP
jgi:predicted transcriptional regulator